MARIGRKNTKPEILLRTALHKIGLRYRLHDNNLPGSPDLVFPRFCAVVFVHGRGGSRRLVLGILDDLHAAGLGVLAFDVRGHGQTEESTPGAAFITGWLDVEAAVKFLREEHGFERVGVFGASQGAANALIAVGRSGGVDALIAQSSVTSLFGMLRGLKVLGFVPRDSAEAFR